MAINYCYTSKELEELLKSIVILIDTREKENLHITDYFYNKGISYKTQKLDFGDYCFMLPSNPSMGIMKNITFKNKLTFERKASLEELSNNLTHKRVEFENELIKASKCKMYILIENSSYKDIVEHKYDTQYDAKAYIATLKTFETRYNLNVNFISSACSGNFIYHTCYYYLREYLKG